MNIPSWLALYLMFVGVAVGLPMAAYLILSLLGLLGGHLGYQ